MNPICRSSLSRLYHHRLHSPLRRQSSPLETTPRFNFSKRWHFGHHTGSDHQHQRPGGAEEGERIFRLGLTADIGLSVGKALTGYLCGSTAIIADAAHSVSDVVCLSFIYLIKKSNHPSLLALFQVLSGVALFSYRAANVPKDKEHPYGWLLLHPINYLPSFTTTTVFTAFPLLRSW